MKTKLFILTLIALTLAISPVFAATFSASPTSIYMTHANDVESITLTNSNSSKLLNLNFAISTLTDGAGHQVTFNSISSIAGLNGSQSVDVKINTIDTGFDIGRYSTTLTVYESSNSSNNMSIPIYFTESYCEEGSINESLIYIKSVDESGSSTDDDWTWVPHDKITIEVDVKNTDDDERDAVVEWDLYDTEQNEFLDIGKDDDVSIDNGDTETVSFTFDVPYDLEDSTNRYLLMIKVYEDGNEEEICGVINEDGKSNIISDLEGIPIEIQRESREVRIIESDQPDVLSCGSSGEIDLKIANVGRSKEDKIKVVMQSSAIADEITRTIDKLDIDDKSETITFPLSVPTDAEEGDYRVEFKVYYDYDKDDDTYDRSFTYSLTDKIQVAGSCESGESASINAFLESQNVVEGGEMTITATITNTGKSTTQYTFVSEGFESWAEEKQVSERIFTLDKGASKTVTMDYNLKDNSAGDHVFTLKVLYNGESIEQPLSVTIEKSGISFGGLSDLFQGNSFLWVIIIINVVLVVIIILVIIRISRE